MIDTMGGGSRSGGFKQVDQVIEGFGGSTVLGLEHRVGFQRRLCGRLKRLPAMGRRMRFRTITRMAAALRP